MQQKEPPRDLLGANIQNFVKTNFMGNFSPGTQKQATRTTRTTIATKNTIVIGPIRTFFVLEKIS